VGNGRRKILAFVLALFALILIPFLIWEEKMSSLALDLMRADRPPLFLFAAITVLLGSDVVFPVPSSLVSTTGGYLLGFAGGFAASWVGMTVGAVIGYGLGRYAALPVLLRFLRGNELEQARLDFARRGDWTLVVSRPVPMLAEASVVLAGVLGRPFGRFFLICGLGNVGVSLVYALVGAYALTANSFLLAFAGAVLIPWLAMRVTRRR
jgi:uncharacterized membrane protein YdjX (TVP38/TMEM64 family)